MESKPDGVLTAPRRSFPEDDLEVVKYRQDLEQLLLAYWRMFLRAPGRKTGPGEVVDLGEIGEVRLQDQRLERANPYSICTGVRR